MPHSQGSPAPCSLLLGAILCRIMRRLDELMNNLEHAATVVGDAGLASLLASSRETLRRGLPFAASLYV